MPGRCERAALPVLPAPEGSPGSWTGTQTSRIPPGTKVKSQGFHPSPHCPAGSALGSGTASSLVRARWKFAWLNPIPDPGWNLGAGKAESSCCSSARNVQGVGRDLPEPGSVAGRKGMQSWHKKLSGLCSGSQNQLCPREPANCPPGCGEKAGNEEWGKGAWAGQWGLGAPHTDPTRAIY